VNDETAREAGAVASKEYSLQGFNEVEVSSAIGFEITQAASYSVRAVGDEKLIESVRAEVSGPTLVLRLRSGLRSFWGGLSHGNVKVVITMPELRKLSASGASKGTARGFKSDQDLALKLSGASQAEIDIEAGKTAVSVSGAGRASGQLKAQSTTITLSGASHCELAGTGGDTRLDASGASKADLSRFQVKNIDVNVSGAGRASINMDGTLNVNLSGASSLEYTGNAAVGKMSVTGASNVRQK
jgi:Putative auto-transporter adhesin, head GIN domain